MDQKDRLFINLKILSNVQPYQKLNTMVGACIVIEDGYWMSPSVTRWLRADNRNNTVKRLSELVEEADSILTKNVSDTHMVERLRTQLQCSRKGMVNLRQTYEADTTILAHFDVLLEKMDRLSGGGPDTESMSGSATEE